ncbi:uncharacterized protein VP01_1016g8 [Puccinia sorghi]|uniref:Signal recognition particle subunit SRP19 n=1 Tax=Puccinia sorghi TaxID=27349 RepID=A0A0L6VVB5_9BASI|nr:uncharacterized protein VP01_1016g8 [Puccinia sorghi]
MAGLSSMLAGMMGAGMTGGSDQQTSHGGKDADRARTKHWETIYPRYLDAKAPCKTGARRVALKYSLRWPLAQLIHHACTQMGLPSHLEIDKVHPADWQNPGRVKVMIKRNGKSINGSIKNKYALLCKIGTFLRPLESARLKLPAVTETTTTAAAAGGPLEPPIGLRLPYNSPAVSHGFLAMAESETDASSSLTTPDHDPSSSSLKTKPSQEPKKSIKPNPAQKKNKKKHKK